MSEENNPHKISTDERKELGRKGRLWTIEVVYRDGHQTRKSKLQNQTSNEIWKFRESIFKVGLMVPIDPRHWQIIPPYDFTLIDLYLQNKYFD